MTNSSHFSLPSHLRISPFPSDTLPQDCYIAPGAQLIGDLRIKEGVSIWFNSVLRGDVNCISVGYHSNIQDGSVIHVTNHHPCIIGNRVTVGHHVNLHGCQVEDYSLIGIGAIVLTGAVIGSGSIIAAGAMVKEGQVVSPNSLMVGIPAKRIKTLSENIIEEHEGWAEKYYQLAQHYLKQNQ